MIGWIIFSAIILILAILLFSSVSVSFKVNEGSYLSVRYLGITLYKFDSNNIRKSDKPKQTTNRKKQNDNSLVTFLKKYATTKKKTELVKELFAILKILFNRFKKLLKKIRFRKFSLNVLVGSEDAAKTAILYGELCSLIYPLVTLLSVCLDFKSENISVNSDFLNSDVKINLSSVIKVRMSSLLGFAMSTAFSVIKYKIGELKNG